MSLEDEFAERWANFHANIDGARSLLGLYPTEDVRKVFENNRAATADHNWDLVQLLKVRDERVLSIFQQWDHPDDLGPTAEAVLDEEVEGPMVSTVAFTYWKYADVVRLFGAVMEGIRQQVLLDQAIVASCTAYERILKDLIPWILKNHRPAAKAYLGTLERPVKALGRFDFDAMQNVDAVFQDEHRRALLPVFPEVVDFYEKTLGIDLFPSADRAKEIRNIFEVRNCIVHNAGKPDERWVRNTGGVEYNTDWNHTSRYVAAIHTEVHNLGIPVFKLLELDLGRGPFLTAECKSPFEWKLDSKPENSANFEVRC